MFWPKVAIIRDTVDKERLIILEQIICIHLYHNAFHCSDANIYLGQKSLSCCSGFVPV